MTPIESNMLEHPFLVDMPPDHVQALSRIASHVHFAEDEFLFRAHEPADRFFLIVSGSVALKVPAPHVGPIPIQTVGPGQALGWSWLSPPYQWHFEARAFEPVRAIALDAGELHRMMEDRPHLGYEMLKRINRIIIQRLQATRLQLLDVYQVV